MARSILREVREGGAGIRISLDKQATTTPKIRAEIQPSSEPAWLVAERSGISGQAVWTEPRTRHLSERRGEGAAATTRG